MAEPIADVAALGRLLRHYGPETNGVHEALRMAVGQVLLSNGYFRQLGLFSPLNATTGTTLFVAAFPLSVRSLAPS